MRPSIRASALSPLALVLLALCAASVRPLSAAEGEDENLRIEQAGFDSHGKAVVVKVSGAATLPERSRIVVTLAYQGRQARDTYASGYVEGGAWSIELGPLEKRPLPGRYVLVVSFNLAEQHPAVRKAWSAGGPGLRPERVIRTKELVFGDPADEQAERERAKADYKGIVERMILLSRDFETAWKELGKKERYVQGEHIDPQAWEELVSKLFARRKDLGKESADLADECLVPLFPQVQERMTSFLSVFLNVVLALTRGRYRADHLAIPEELNQLDRLENLFKDIGRLTGAREGLEASLPVLEKGSEEPALALGQDQRSPDEEKKLVREHVRAWMAKLDAARKELDAEVAARRARMEPAAGGASGAAAFDAASWDAWYRPWAVSLSKLRLVHKVVQLDTAMDADGLIALKFPSVYEYTDQLVNDVGQLALGEAGALFRRAGLAVPAAYLAVGVDGASLTPQAAEEERDRLRTTYESRLEQVSGILGIPAEPPPAGGEAPGPQKK
ncbi:MAG: hypothetical protein HYZ53_28910 [Planctomycetes bacterium]|nr:hypothetical protein [Planctomycetota bacterium]